MALTWFDAHLDLAYLAVNGRDMLGPLDPAAGPHPPAALTLPALAEGGVRLALATIFTEVGGAGPEGYPAGDWARAAAVGRAQLEVYRTWAERGRVALDLRRVLRVDRGVGEIRGGMGVAEVVAPSVEKRLARAGCGEGSGRLCAGVLIENADPVRGPEELEWWRSQGVVAIGLAWARASRYAGGNGGGDGGGISDLGREMVREMDRLGLVHDASHLSDRAFAELLELTDRPVIASHSNCRALLGDPGNQRHLTDDAVRAIARRGGVIGLNLYSRFLRAGLGEEGRASIDDCLAHVERVCELAGNRACVGLGSDLDGGFAASRLPEGIDAPVGYARLAEGLAARGWSGAEIEGFACGNWARVFGGQSPGR